MMVPGKGQSLRKLKGVLFMVQKQFKYCNLA